MLAAQQKMRLLLQIACQKEEHKIGELVRLTREALNTRRKPRPTTNRTWSAQRLITFSVGEYKIHTYTLSSLIRIRLSSITCAL